MVVITLTLTPKGWNGLRAATSVCYHSLVRGSGKEALARSLRRAFWRVSGAFRQQYNLPPGSGETGRARPWQTDNSLHDTWQMLD